MTKEQLREKCFLTLEERNKIFDNLQPEWTTGLERIALLEAQLDKALKTVQQYIDDNHIKQVVEGELPNLLGKSGYKKTGEWIQEDMSKWHKQSLKPVRLV